MFMWFFLAPGTSALRLVGMPSCELGPLGHDMRAVRKSLSVVLCKWKHILEINKEIVGRESCTYGRRKLHASSDIILEAIAA